MRITKYHLKRLIKEETASILKERQQMKESFTREWDALKKALHDEWAENDQRGYKEWRAPETIAASIIYDSQLDNEDLYHLIEEAQDEYNEMYDDSVHVDLDEVADALQDMAEAENYSRLEDEATNPFQEGKKAAKTVGDPPYRERGATESQAQQKAAGMAYSCRKKRGAERKKCADELKSHGGAAWDLYDGEITYKELRNLATLGQKVKQHKSKEPQHLKSLPGHAIPAKD